MRTRTAQPRPRAVRPHDAPIFHVPFRRRNLLREIDLSSLPIVGAEHGRIRHDGPITIISAAGSTDAFVPPDGAGAVDRLPGLRFACPSGPWTLSLRVAPEFGAAFDAGALMLRASTGAWAKLAFEQAPDGRPMAVSVVTKDTSDDANGPPFASRFLHLRACFTGKAYAFHHSQDGTRWDLLRFFALPGTVFAVDIVAQSPTGTGCTVRFDQVLTAEIAPEDLRDGT